jgi:fructose-1-phosphate kinase PfkB-like protein
MYKIRPPIPLVRKSAYIEQLDERILFSADVAALIAGSPPTVNSPSVAAPVVEHIQAGHELVVVDSRVEGLTQLL